MTLTTAREGAADVPAFYRRDLERFDAAFRKHDAIATLADGFTYIDETKVPASLVRAYRLLIRYGAANGHPLSLAEINSDDD